MPHCVRYDRESYEKKSDYFKALSHPARLWMVEKMYKEGEQCVCSFVDEVGDNFSTISRHLRLLKESDIITSEKRGKWVYYRLRLACILEFLQCVDNACRAKMADVDSVNEQSIARSVLTI